MPSEMFLKRLGGLFKITLLILLWWVIIPYQHSKTLYIIVDLSVPIVLIYVSVIALIRKEHYFISVFCYGWTAIAFLYWFFNGGVNRDQWITYDQWCIAVIIFCSAFEIEGKAREERQEEKLRELIDKEFSSYPTSRNKIDLIVKELKIVEGLFPEYFGDKDILDFVELPPMSKVIIDGTPPIVFGSFFRFPADLPKEIESQIKTVLKKL